MSDLEKILKEGGAQQTPHAYPFPAVEGRSSNLSENNPNKNARLQIIQEDSQEQLLTKGTATPEQQLNNDDKAESNQNRKNE